MSDESETWHTADMEDCRDDYHYCDNDYCDNNRTYPTERRILSKLNNSIEAPKKRNEKAKVGEMCRCPMCGKKFSKKVYQQKFCCNKCKVKYHNKRQVYY